MLFLVNEDVMNSPQALGVLHDDSGSGKVRPLQASLQQLLLSVRTPCCPSYTAAVLLRALSHVSGQVRTGTPVFSLISELTVQ